MDFDPKKNYYEILWVWEDASQDEIKKAFRKWAVKYHPDRWWSKEKFQEINEAYQVLSDEKKKQQYDLYRKWWFGAWWFWGGGFDFWGFNWGWASFDFWDIWDLLWWMFGWSGFWWGRSRKPSQWETLEKHISITFEEAYLWVKKKIAYTRNVKVEWAVEEKCSHCNWTGRVSQQTQTPFWVFQTQSACPECWWVWTLYKKDGKILKNWGLQWKKETLDLDIPAGIKSWSFLKYAGKGDEGIWWVPAWDLYIRIDVEESSKYERRQDDLYVKAEATLFDLVLWGEVEVAHPEWKLKVKIPKGTQIGQKIRVGGKWFGEKSLFGKRGDLIVELQVSVPKKLSKDQEKLWKELQNM